MKNREKFNRKREVVEWKENPNRDGRVAFSKGEGIRKDTFGFSNYATTLAKEKGFCRTEQ